MLLRCYLQISTMIPISEALGNDHISDKAQLIYSDDAKDEDVKAEEDVVKKEKYENVTPTGISIQVQGLVKTFSKVSWKGMCCKPSVLQYAVKVRDKLPIFKCIRSIKISEDLICIVCTYCSWVNGSPCGFRVIYHNQYIYYSLEI